MVVDLLSKSVDGWDLLQSVIVIIIGWIIGAYAKRNTVTLLDRVWPSITPESSMMVARLVRYSILLVTFGVVLTILGAQLQPLLAAALLVSAVAVLALRGLASNLGAGLVIQARHVVRLGDEIEILDKRGVVKEISGRSVTIHTDDGRAVRLPNSEILENPLTNLTERDLYRSELEVRFVGDRQYAEVRTVIEKALAECDRIRAVPAVQVLLARHVPGAMTFRVRFWHPPQHRSEIRSAAVVSLVERFEAEKLVAAVDWAVPDAPLTPPPSL
jgi:small conductance mechanosensitive channel